MVEFRVLGITGLRRDDGTFDHSFLTGPKRLALLTYLMLARPRSFHRRDKLLALFWPEIGEKSARNSLSNMLYHIRSSLGDEILINRGSEEISINFEEVWCDVLVFEHSLEGGKPREALNYYHGDLLQGFHVTDISNSFESWLAGERETLRKQAAEASWLLADEAEEMGNLGAAQSWTKKAISYTDLSEEAHIRLVKLLERTGQRTEALKTYEEFTEKLRNEWEMEPSGAFRQLINKIRSHESVRSVQQKEEGMTVPERSIAVLPFVSLGKNDEKIFVEGLHDDLLTRLSNISGIEVTSRTSVIRYRNTEASLRDISRELGVNWIVEGSVQHVSSSVHVRVRLVNTVTDRQLWARDFHKELTLDNIFRIQSEITLDIAAALEAEMTPKEKRRVKRQPTENLAAYRLYMQGFSWVEQRTEKGIRRALEFFDEAIEQDSTFALAMTGRALALLALYGYGFEVTDKVLAEAEVLIRKALQQDEDLTEARCALGLLHCERHEGPEALRELKRAIELRPGYANAHNKLSWASQLMGEKEQALESAQNAVNLDPFSPESVVNLAFSKLINEKKEDALTEVRRVRKLQPTWSTGPFYEAVILYHQGKYAEAKKLLQNLSVTWVGEGSRTVLALADLKLGDKSSVRNHLGYLQDKEDYFSLGLVQSALGKKEEALSAFECIESWGAWPTLSLNHLFSEDLAILKEEPVFRSIFKKMRQNWGVEEIPEGG